MNLINPKFVQSMSKYDEEEILPLDQVAVVGKSNVGKSSFINCVTNNNKLCKVGKTPGKTRLINIFDINNKYFLVDLPGYGFAKRSREEMEKWGTMIEDYLGTSNHLKLIILLLDIRHDPTGDDVLMFKWIQHYEKNCIIIATKAEKVAKTKRKQKCIQLKKDLGFDGMILPIDSTTNYGRDEIVEVLNKEFE